jgi:hypothetical protein
MEEYIAPCVFTHTEAYKDPSCHLQLTGLYKEDCQLGESLLGTLSPVDPFAIKIQMQREQTAQTGLGHQAHQEGLKSHDQAQNHLRYQELLCFAPASLLPFILTLIL